MIHMNWPLKVIQKALSMFVGEEKGFWGHDKICGRLEIISKKENCKFDCEWCRICHSFPLNKSREMKERSPWITELKSVKKTIKFGTKGQIFQIMLLLLIEKFRRRLRTVPIVLGNCQQHLKPTVLYCAVIESYEVKRLLATGIETIRGRIRASQTRLNRLKMVAWPAKKPNSFAW